ncbi:uncharacterized protein Z520_10730 [Fonsecaea multimorphosa CBS 102226]|uniref:CMP/dCMP-type deaminase domain-containing protein n=1 Tax=Fonsecaea multimorphosa CBS 102226 TaxID=1442371 RepID=A0A0D2JJZ4_9EURO|nr:uncharacterized protein Z520_10730 [Fonsecaea multimorphosa CBS 102226]KIX93552.1 hypothetical protein Z520_10730 [Fonsecaea multimorphosa CBS 102226]OAL18867.1 hypothetical protein AYO22_10196 [Fonsecaea multimorphosa]
MQLPFISCALLLFSGWSFATSNGCDLHDPSNPCYIAGAGGSDLGPDPVPSSIRAYWMRRAIAALADINEGSPCPFAAFGSVIVNHTASGEGDGTDQLGVEVCIGANSLVRDGNPTLHGEIAAINNCSRILTDPDGPYKLSGPDALKALGDLSLYTTAEACPMCSSAILYGGFREYIFSTSIPTLRSHGWPQIVIRSREIFARSVGRLSVHRTRIIGDLLANETEGLFKWQFDANGCCPGGCEKDGSGGCVMKSTKLDGGIGKDEL